MPRRIEQVNKNIQRIVGELLQREVSLPTDVLVTISTVETKPNFRSATVWLYIFPTERAEEVLTLLKESLPVLQQGIAQELDGRHAPHLRLRIDYGAEHAERITKTLEEIADEDENTPS